MTRQMDRLFSDRTGQIEARMFRLDGSLNKLVELIDRREVRIRQQRDRELSAIAELRERFASGTSESKVD